MSHESQKYMLDKTVFRATKVEDADDHYARWKNESWKERLYAACYLIHRFYGTTPQTPLNKTVFTKRRHLRV